MSTDPLINAMISVAYEIRLAISGDHGAAHSMAREVCRRMLPHLCDQEIDMTLRAVLAHEVPA
ncbi:hypothetical protein WCLP8_1460005 [uncultured Gammaproteobacteria bacterium]